MRIGMDIGGTKIDAVALDDSGQLVARVRRATGFGAEEVVATATAAVNSLIEQTGLSAHEFDSIGIGIPGAVDSDAGIVSHAVNLGVEELDLGRALGDSLGVAVRIENDVKAAALGAYQLLFGAEVGQAEPLSIPDKSMAYLNLGTGLAAGLVLGGRLWRGSRGTAGEIGHIPVDPVGVLCSCGQRGCLETLASGSAITRQWRSDDPIPVLSLLAAAERGDAAAVEIARALVENVAAAVRVLVLTVDVEAVVIGGGLSHLGEPLLEDIRGVLRTWAADSPFLASLELESRVQLVPSDFPVAAVGAALVGRAPALMKEN